MPDDSSVAVESSFEDMAEDFDDLFSDVNELTELEGEALHRVLEPYHVSTVLDCACGTGVQAIGLARRGYSVAASDISPAMVAKTRHKASQEGFNIELKESDFRDLNPWSGRKFDAVVNSGNSITLVADETDVLQALQSMVGRMKSSGGIGIVGIHNYHGLRQDSADFYLRYVISHPDEFRLVADLRKFDHKRVEVNNIFVRHHNERWDFKTHKKSYLLLDIARLKPLMIKAGFNEVYLRDISGHREYQNDEWVLAIGVT